MATATPARASALVLGLLTASALVPLWLAHPLPLQDVPNHLVKVDALRRYVSGDPAARELWALNPAPVPNLFCYGVLWALSALMPLEATVRVYLTGALMALAWAGWCFVRATGRRPAVALMIPGTMYSVFLAKGFLNFVAALPMYLAALVLAVREPFGRRAAVALATLATVLYLTHGFVFIALVMTVAGWSLLRTVPFREAIRRAGALAPGCLLLLVWLQTGGPGVEGRREIVFGSLVDRLWDALAIPFGFAFGSVASLAWLTAAAVLVAAPLASAGRDSESFRRAATTPFLVVGLGMTVLYFFGFDVAASNARARWWLLALLTLAGAAGLPAADRLRRGTVVILVASALWLHALNARALVRESGSVREYASGMVAVEPGAAILPVHRGSASAGQRPTLHAWGWYVLARGGWTPYTHAWRNQHPIVYRIPPWAPGEEVATPFPPHVAQRVAACYDYLLVWGARDSPTDDLRRHFELVFERGGLEVWRNRAGVRRGTPLSTPACRRDADEDEVERAA